MNQYIVERVQYTIQYSADMDSYACHEPHQPILHFKLWPHYSLQISIDAVPPPSHWTPEWWIRMHGLDLSAHLHYLQSFVISARGILGMMELQQQNGDGGVPNAQSKLQEVGSKMRIVYCPLFR